jgi:hypothetical protein
VYKNNPCTTKALQNEISAVTSRVELQKVFELVYVLGSTLEDRRGSLTAVIVKYIKFVLSF